MNELELLQHYWWLLIAVLGAALVFLLFVQGGQSMLYCGTNVADRQLMVNALGRKWELTFTTLVVFGGAFFASFPLFYSTSFGGAYWVWMLILLSFVLQAVSYEFRRKRGNLYGTRTYDAFLFFNGLIGCVVLGAAVASFFFGGAFTVSRMNIVDGMFGMSSPVISQWAPTHGLEMLIDWHLLLLGVAVFFLARTQAAMYFLNAIKSDDAFMRRMSRATLVNGVIFAVLFVAWLVVMLMQPAVVDIDGVMTAVPYAYLNNMLDMWWLSAIFVIGVVMVLAAIFFTATRPGWRKGIWLCGIGTVLVVVMLILLAGLRGTAYLPSTVDISSSLTIANSSSSLFTLKVMSWVSVIVPFVLAYIAYVWRKMNARQITDDELNAPGEHQY